MALEATLAYLHILAILTMVTFLASEAALCRSAWMNAQVVERLVRLDMIYAAAAVTVLATGIARTVWGVKGMGWYWTNPLLHLRLTLFVVIVLISIGPTLRFVRWRRQLRASGALPTEAEVRSTRKLVMIEAHLVAVIPLAAVFLARGYGG